MSTPQSPLLDRPVGVAARLILRRFLEQARDTVPRLSDEEDVEALHDFRVAIRRARSAARSWRGALAPDIKKRHVRALSRLQRATGEGRDAEVMLGWISEQRAQVSELEAVGVTWIMEGLAARKAVAYARARQEVAGPLSALCETLLSRLREMRVAVEPLSVPAEAFGAVLSAETKAQTAVLERRLRAVTGVDDDDGLHSARIDCKRLRYLVAPIRDANPAVSTLVKQCKSLQDVLGLIQDARVLDGELTAQVNAVTAESATDPRLPGLRVLMRLNKERKQAQYDLVTTRWQGPALGALVRAVEAVGAALGGDLVFEIERKYLLDGLPPEARRGRQKFIDQGYLPGKTLIERVRRIQTDDGERYVRTVKVGKGIKRVELEEETDRHVFQALWALTPGCRVSKTRYTVADGDFMWEIDDFADRNLVLAEVELPTADTPISIPEWLEPYLVREVTEEGQYTNWKLAK